MTKENSKKALKSIEGSKKSLRERVFDYIESQSEFGATDYEVERHLGIKHQTASVRRRELVKDLRVIDSGYSRKTGSGRWATVWRVLQPEDKGSPEYVAQIRELKRAEILSKVKRLDDQALFQLGEILDQMDKKEAL